MDQKIVDMSSASRTVSHRRTIGRGLTAVELLMALGICGLILMGLASLLTTTAAGWHATDVSASVSVTSNRVGTVVESILRDAKYVTVIEEDAAGSRVLLWSYDGVTGSPDGIVQLGELALLEFVAADRTIRLFRPSTDLSGSDLTAAQRSDFDPEDPMLIEAFKAQSFVDAPLTVVGSDEDGRIGITSASFQFLHSASVRPSVLYTLQVTQGESTRVVGGRAVLRAPMRPRVAS